MMRLALRFLIVLFLTVAGVNAQQLVIGVGTTANDGSGDPVRTAFQKANTNFTAVFLNILTVSNTVTANTANITTVSNSVGVVAANLTTVSNTVTVNTGNITTVSNSVGTVAANLTIVSNSLTTVSNSLTGKINAQTGTTYSFLAADAGKLTTFTNTSAVAVTLGFIGPFPDGTVFHVKNLGVGVVTITSTAATIDFATTLILTKGQSASIFSDGVNYRTTLIHPNVSSEIAANTTTFLNPKGLTTKQTLSLYHTSDSYSSPVNYARLQIAPDSFDFNEAGTGSVGGFRLRYNGVNKVVYEPSNGDFNIDSGAVYGWAVSTPGSGSFDTALRKKSAGVVTVNISRSSASNDTGQFSSINGLSIGSIFTQTADATVENTTTETSILASGSGTKTVAAGAVNKVGRTLRVRIKGMISNAAGAPTLTIRFKVATVTVLSGVFTVANATNDSFDFNVEMTTRTTGTSGTFSSNGRFNHNMTTGSVGGVSLVFSGTQTNNLTLSNAIDVTAQWSAANSSNTVGSQIATIEILN